MILRPSVISSAYSSSPPTGTPLAIDVTLTGKSFQFLVNIERRGVAFHGWTEGEDHFTDLAVRSTHSSYQRFDLQFFGANAINGRYDAAEHVINACVLRRIFDGHHILAFFHNTHKCAIAAMTPADIAFVFVADVSGMFCRSGCWCESFWSACVSAVVRFSFSFTR